MMETLFFFLNFLALFVHCTVMSLVGTSLFTCYVSVTSIILHLLQEHADTGSRARRGLFLHLFDVDEELGPVHAAP